jgi:penicillin-binding protein A
MNKRLKLCLTFLAAIVLALAGTLTYRQSFSDSIAAHPGNRRALLEEYSIDRGEIFAADGTVLATNESTAAGLKRVYPGGAPFAPVTGYYSPVRGKSGLEAGWADWLAARRRFDSFDDWFSSLANKKGRRGFDLTLTIDPALQLEAWRLLGDNRGAVVVLDPRDGAVRALVSKPSFDPGVVEEDWEALASIEGLLINRATQSLYPPGSTFKIITTAAALEAGIAKPGSVFNGPASLPVYGSRVTNFADRDHGRIELREAFAKSTNTVFAQVGLDLGAKRFSRSAGDFGIGGAVPFDLPVTDSSMADYRSMDQVMLAWSAVGQGRTLVTPLQMAMITAAVAGDGQIYRPFLVKTVRNYQGMLKYRRQPEPWRQPISAKTAGKINKMMVETVRAGTGRAAALPEVTVAGKTGTAELGSEREPHAWFAGFAPAQAPELVVVVLIENGGQGGRIAAPIARRILLKGLTL